MTKAEVIECLEKNIKLHEKFNETKHQSKAIKALNMAIDALEQESSDDLISRQDAIDVVRQYCIDNQIEDGDYHANGIKYELKELPSAQQEPKRGKWVYDAEAYPCGNPYGHYDCDQCGESVPDKTKYCPNCGADMRGDEE